MIGTEKDLVLYRIETAKEDLKSAKILRDAGYAKGSLPNKVVGFFCVYDEPSADSCLHENLHLVNVHHRTVR